MLVLEIINFINISEIITLGGIANNLRPIVGEVFFIIFRKYNKDIVQRIRVLT